MESTVIKIKIIGKYGNALAYPMNETAELFCRIAGRKTLTKKSLELIKKLGFTVEVEGYGVDDVSSRARGES